MNQSDRSPPLTPSLPGQVFDATRQRASAPLWTWGVLGTNEGFEARGLLGNIHVQVGTAQVTEFKAVGNEQEMWLTRHDEVSTVLEPPAALANLLRAGHATHYLVYRRSVIRGVMLNGWALYRFAREFGGARTGASIGVFALTDILPDEAQAVMAPLKKAFAALLQAMPRSPGGEDVQFNQTLSTMFGEGQLDPVRAIFAQHATALVQGPAIASAFEPAMWKPRHDHVFMQRSLSADALERVLRSPVTVKSVIWPSLFDASLHQPAVDWEKIPAPIPHRSPAPEAAIQPAEPLSATAPQKLEQAAMPQLQAPPMPAAEPQEATAPPNPKDFDAALFSLEGRISRLSERVHSIEGEFINRGASAKSESESISQNADHLRETDLRKYEAKLTELAGQIERIEREYASHMEQFAAMRSGQRRTNIMLALGLMGALLAGAWVLYTGRISEPKAQSNPATVAAADIAPASAPTSAPAFSAVAAAPENAGLQSCKAALPLVNFQLDLRLNQDKPIVEKLAEGITQRCFKGVPENCQKLYQSKIERAFKNANYPSVLPARVPFPAACESSVNDYLTETGLLKIRSTEPAHIYFNFAADGTMPQADVNNLRAFLRNNQYLEISFAINCRNQPKEECEVLLKRSESKMSKIFDKDFGTKKINYVSFSKQEIDKDVLVTALY